MQKIHFLEKMVLLIGLFIVSGFRIFTFYPSGTISIMQYKLVFIAFITMLTIVIPVIFMIFYFIYRYRRVKKSTYNPDWNHSKIIEMIVWTLPIIIIVFLGILTWNTSHILDPKKNISSTRDPIKINVVALDWKWMFIYPKENIATINELIIPNDTPINFTITSNSVMSSFFIPSLGSQVYAMPGMTTQLNLISNYPGKYSGFSANYNGKGFSDMKFNTIVVPNMHIFNLWVKKVQQNSAMLSKRYELQITSIPSVKNQVKYFSHVNPNFFDNIIHKHLH